MFGGQIGALGGTALQRVSARGATPAALTSLKGDEFAHGFPSFLPDGKHFLYLAQSPASSELRVGSLTSQEYVSLGRYESNAQYAAGYLFTVRSANLMSQPFDATTFRLDGSPSYIAPRVGAVLNRGLFSVARFLAGPENSRYLATVAVRRAGAATAKKSSFYHLTEP